MSNLAGVGIALLTVLAIVFAWILLKAMFTLADALQEIIFDSDANILWKLLFFIPWLVIRLITVIFFVAGALCGISLVKDGYKWLNK